MFQLLAFLSGFGGGNFASSMSNISFFFPKRMQGLALGLNAGLGNAGVTTMQLLIPLVMTNAVFGGGSMVLEQTSGTLIGKIAAGTETWIHNAGFVWLVLLIPLAFLAWFKMNNIRTEHVSPNIGGPLASFGKILGMLLSRASRRDRAVHHPARPDRARRAVVDEVAGHRRRSVATVFLLKQIPGEIKPNLERQYKIFEHKHTWIMSVIYTMTFGSFIGYSAGFALAIKVIFGFKHIEVDGVLTHDTPTPTARRR